MWTNKHIATNHLIKHICCHPSMLSITSNSYLALLVYRSHRLLESANLEILKPRLPAFSSLKIGNRSFDKIVRTRTRRRSMSWLHRPVCLDSSVSSKIRRSLGDTKNPTQCANDVPRTSNHTTMRSSGFSGNQFPWKLEIVLYLDGK